MMMVGWRDRVNGRDRGEVQPTGLARTGPQRRAGGTGHREVGGRRAGAAVLDRSGYVDRAPAAITEGRTVIYGTSAVPALRAAAVPVLEAAGTE